MNRNGTTRLHLQSKCNNVLRATLTNHIRAHEHTARIRVHVRWSRSRTHAYIYDWIFVFVFACGFRLLQ